MNNIRIGHGYDIHQLADGKKLIIGGVEVPHSKGAVAHSDGDVLYHAIIDSLLGAIAEGDIGKHFPPSDPAYKDIDSALLLEKAYSLIQNRGYAIGNIDTTVILEKPKLRGHIDFMRKNIAAILNTDINNVSVKAKTKENCDATGEGNAIEAFSSVLLVGT
ncbi:MAG: 2-C-methyl-D-erythritol 2,4-cyclodiphosphate synthase [Spirochaetaceae bacterium]|nr:2-C-methyl-D-erythritol 2,4-cyclodiphosphate synthase [Spirochaetaceae bacterium]